MAQLVARLVRNEKVGGSNPPSSTTGRHPIRMSVFCMPGRVGVVPVVVLLVAPLVFRALRVLCWAGLLSVPMGGGPPASRPRSELRSARRLEARPGPAASHGQRSLALHTGGIWRADGVRTRPGPAAAHEHRSLALRSLRRPPHWRHLACWCVADRAPSPPTGAAAWTRRRPSTRGQGFRLDCNSCFQRGTCEPCV